MATRGTVRGGHLGARAGRSRGRAASGRTARRSSSSRSSARRLSTREYGLPVTRSWRNANYAYARGAGRDRGRRPSYPIDPRHVRAALTYSARRNTAGSASRVRYALRQRYGSVAKALAAARRAGH